MRTLREWLHRLLATFVPHRRDEDLEEELRLHQELAAEDARRRGHGPDEAVRMARLEAGGPAQAMEDLRAQRALPWLEDLARDVKYALRTLRRSPAFTVVALLTLALGIGANAAIFHLIDTLSFRSLPVANPHELADVRADGIDGFGFTTGPNGRVTYPLWEQIRTHQRAFAGVFAWSNAGLIVGRGAGARPADGLWVSGDFFRVLGIRPARGRLLVDSDDPPGCGASVAVVSHDFWRAALGGSESVVGSTLTIVDRPFTVVGVAAAGFTGLEAGRAFDLALPLCIGALGTDQGGRRDVWWLRVMGRLGPDWSLRAADAHLRTISPGILDATAPEGYSAELLARYRAFRFGAFPVARGVSRLRETHGMSLSLLLGLTGLVLLITCGNLATLMLARAGAREREIAMRVALGAPRRRLVSQMVVESLMVAVAGAAAAVPVALVSARGLVAFLDTTDNPISLTLTADWRLMAFVAAAAVLTTVLFGLVPALRVSMVNPIAATRQTSRGLTVDRHRARLRRGLVAGQIALSLVLVVSSLLFVRSFRNLSAVPLGFDPDPVVVATFFDLGGFPPSPQRAAFRQKLLDTIQSAPGVASAAATTHVLLSGNVFSHFFRLPEVRADETKVSRFAYVGPGYFETLGIPILAGRGFNEHDDATSAHVILVNESFVRHHLGEASPLGARLRTVAEAGYPEVTYEIVGLVGDTKYSTLRDEDCLCDAGRNPMPPIAYVPIAQDPSPSSFLHVIARARGQVPAVTAAIAARVDTPDPGVGVQIVQLAPRIRELLATDLALAWLAGGFGVLAIVLVVVGVYGVIAYFAISRRTEIGIRLALGSTRARIVGLVLRDSLWLLALGAIIGLPLGVWAMRGAGALLFGISAADLTTLAGATVLLAAAGIIAGSLPACRAALLPPMAAIRDEPESMWRTARVAVQRAVRELTAGGERTVGADELMGDVAGAIHRAGSFPDAVRVALDVLRTRVGAPRVLLLEKTGDEYRSQECAIPARGILINRLTHYPHPLRLTPGDFQAWRQWAREVRPEYLAEIETLEDTRVRVAVPLHTSHELVGVLLLGGPEARETFTLAETEILSRAAGVFALLIENANLNGRALEQEKLRRDLSLAAEVQKRLLPTEPPAAEIAEFSAMSLPARSIGGDYYDFIQVGDRRIGIALADVSGKGIAAALIMSVVQASLRIIASDPDVSLPDLAARMNDFLYRTTPGNKYATFFYALLDSDRRQLRYVNAGHNPPLLVRAGAPERGPDVHELTVGGAVVGMLPSPAYDEAIVDLNPGDVLLAFTDGVTEAHNPEDAEFGDERLKDLLKQIAHLSATEIAARVSGAVQEWIRDAEQYDDLTFVVMKVR